MTVLNGVRPAKRKPLLHSALGVFVPKPRATVIAGPAAPSWLQRYGRRLKEGVVAAVVCGLPTVAAFQWHTWAGLVATGIAVLVVDAAADPEVIPDERAG